MPKQCQTPCKQCPFARATPKEYLDTRGQNGERFAGQSIGSFMLPCHMTSQFEEFRSKPLEAPLCAGAAMFRANIGVDAYLPEAIGRLPENHEKSFSSIAELLAHHEGTTVEQAAKKLLEKPAMVMLWEELAKQKDITHVKIPQ